MMNIALTLIFIANVISNVVLALQAVEAGALLQRHIAQEQGLAHQSMPVDGGEASTMLCCSRIPKGNLILWVLAPIRIETSLI